MAERSETTGGTWLMRGENVASFGALKRPIVAMLEQVQQDGNDGGDTWEGSIHSPIVGNWFGMSETMCT
jgi:hypothetical protein